MRYQSLGKLVTEKPVDFVGFDNVVEFNKNRQNDDNVVKAYNDDIAENSSENCCTVKGCLSDNF